MRGEEAETTGAVATHFSFASICVVVTEFVIRTLLGRFHGKQAIRADTADDRFAQVPAGLSWPVGDVPPVIDPTTVATIEPPVEPDVEKYFVEGTYNREIRKKLTWNVGGSWDRNEDAGILDRYIGFAGLGTVWHKRSDLVFLTE